MSAGFYPVKEEVASGPLCRQMHRSPHAVSTANRAVKFYMDPLAASAQPAAVILNFRMSPAPPSAAQQLQFSRLASNNSVRHDEQ
jgi:hypothetical protein